MNALLSTKTARNNWGLLEVEKQYQLYSHISIFTFLYIYTFDPWWWWGPYRDAWTKLRACKMFQIWTTSSRNSHLKNEMSCFYYLQYKFCNIWKLEMQYFWNNWTISFCIWNILNLSHSKWEGSKVQNDLNLRYSACSQTKYILRTLHS